MSSFIVEQKTINRIVSKIESSKYGSSISHCMIRDVLTKYCIDLRQEKAFDELANSLLAMNKLAVNQRYTELNLIQLMKFEHVQVSNVQALKSMECLQYQCSEGTVPKLKLYKFLKDLIGVMRTIVINEIPEYSKAEWG